MDATRGDAPVGRDLSVSMADANRYALFIAGPLAVVLVVPYLAIWGLGRLWAGLDLSPGRLLLALALIVLGIVAHEAIHALAWMVFGRKPRSAIRFGFAVRALAPYAHCTEPMEVNAYRVGGLLPGVILGLLPWLAGLLTGNPWPALFGLLFSVSAAGDLLVLWLIRRVPAGRRVQDHPTRAGCYVLDAPPPG